jgi:Rhodanese-like domain
VETDWLGKHLKDDGIRIIESNEDILLYDTGHIPGAVHIDWRADLQDPVVRDYISPEKFARLCSRHGITPDTTCIFYGDKANWWACYALWAFRLFGHEKVKILNGGRDKWKAEGRPMTREIPKYAETSYPVPKKRFDKEIRAFFDEALMCVRRANTGVRSRTCPSIRRKACCAAAIFPEPRVCRGRRLRTMMPRSSQPRNWQRFISNSVASAPTKTPLSIAESASAPVTPGLCLLTC